MRRGLKLAALAVVMVALGAPALAQDYPARPVRIIVPFPPGGSSDVHARIVAQKLSAQTGRQFVVDNRVGAGGVIGMQATAQATPDGYTIVQATAGTIALTPAMSREQPYDAARDFVPLGFTAREPNTLIVHPALPIRTMDDLVAYVRARPDGVHYWSSGAGTPAHLGVELLARAKELKLIHVPYRGAATAVADVVTGQVAFAYPTFASVKGQLEGGLVRLIAVTGSRLAAYPDVPTVTELGIPEMNVPIWFGYFAPAGTPRPVVERLFAELMRALADREFVASLREQAMEPFPPDQKLADLPQFVAETVRLSKDIVQRTGIRLD